MAWRERGQVLRQEKQGEDEQQPRDHQGLAKPPVQPVREVEGKVAQDAKAEENGQGERGEETTLQIDDCDDGEQIYVEARGADQA